MFAKKLAILTQKYAEMYEHEIVFQEKRRFFSLKISDIAKNSNRT
jgi:hypothetical protein